MMNNFSDNPYEPPIRAELAQQPKPKPRGVGRIFIQFVLLELITAIIAGFFMIGMLIGREVSAPIYPYAFLGWVACIAFGVLILLATLVRLLWSTL